MIRKVINFAVILMTMLHFGYYRGFGQFATYQFEIQRSPAITPAQRVSNFDGMVGFEINDEDYAIAGTTTNEIPSGSPDDKSPNHCEIPEGSLHVARFKRTPTGGRIVLWSNIFYNNCYSSGGCRFADGCRGDNEEWVMVNL